MPETLFLTVNLIDRFLEAKQVTRRNLQLVSGASQWQPAGQCLTIYGAWHGYSCACAMQGCKQQGCCASSGSTGNLHQPTAACAATPCNLPMRGD